MNYVGSLPDIPSAVTTLVKRPGQVLNTQTQDDALGIIEVVSIEQPAAYDRGSACFTDTIKKWRMLINQECEANSEAEKVLFQDQLKEIPWQNAGRGEVAQIRRCAFPWGKAILFVTVGYAQGKTGGVVSNESLVLVVQGFTNDGRYAISGHLRVRHRDLPDFTDGRDRRGKIVFDFDEEGEKAAKWLEVQPDDSFEPMLLQYENLLESLRIEPRSQYPDGLQPNRH